MPERELESDGRLVGAAGEDGETPRLRGELERLRREMERLRPLAVVASSVVHDIRNCLGVISSTSQFALRQLHPADKEREAWERVDRNVENIRGILQGYLGLARRAENARSPISLNQIVERVCGFLDAQCRKQNVALEKSLDRSIPLLEVDVPALETAILNLSLNALESMPAGGRIGFRTREENGERNVLLEISDSGPGIPRELLGKIFTPFFTTKTAGTGMGLYSARACLEGHGGRLLCDSKPGEGTRMTLFFPAALNVKRLAGFGPRER